jgi:DNA topoisomerase IB
MFPTPPKAEVRAMSSADAYCGRGPNTPAICRKSYVHPEILSAYMSGDLVKMIDAKIARKFKQQYAQLSADEIMVLAEGLPS